MFGKESEELQRLRLQRQSQYAADLQQQMNDKNKTQFQPPQNVRQKAANEIIGITPSKEPLEPRPYYPDYPESARSYDSGMQKINYAIDRALNIEIPSRLKPVNETLSSMNMKIETSLSTTREQISSMKDKFNEINFNITNINNKAVENNQRIQNALNDIRKEYALTREFNEATAVRVQQLESRYSVLDDTLRSIQQRQQIMEKSLSDQMAHVSNSIAQVSRDYGESDAQIMQNVEQLNRQSIQTFSHMQQDIQTVAAALSESVNNLSLEARSSFEVVRSENDNAINALKSAYEQNAIDTQQAFNAIQEEVVSTFASVHGLVENTVNSITQVVSNESSNRRQNEMKMLESYDVFTVQIAGQLANNTKAIDRIEANVRTNVETLCASFLSSWKNDLSAFLKEVSTSIGECQSRVSLVETKLADYVISVGKRQDEIMELVGNAQIETTSLDNVELNQRVQKLEQFIEGQNLIPATPKLVSATTVQKSTNFRPPIVKNRPQVSSTVDVPKASPINLSVKNLLKEKDLENEEMPSSPISYKEEISGTPTNESYDYEPRMVIKTRHIFELPANYKLPCKSTKIYVSEPVEVDGLDLALPGRAHRRTHQSKKNVAALSQDPEPVPEPEKEPEPEQPEEEEKPEVKEEVRPKHKKERKEKKSKKLKKEPEPEPEPTHLLLSESDGDLDIFFAKDEQSLMECPFLGDDEEPQSPRKKGKSGKH